MGIDKQLSLNGWIMGLDYGNCLPTAIRWGTLPMPLVPLHRTVQSVKLRFPGFQMWGELDNWFLCVSLWLSMAIQSSSMIHTGIHTTAAKAGKSRHLGFTPHVRGSAKNACDHAHGGGEGRCNGADPLKLQGHGTAWHWRRLNVRFTKVTRSPIGHKHPKTKFGKYWPQVVTEKATMCFLFCLKVLIHWVCTAEVWKGEDCKTIGPRNYHPRFSMGFDVPCIKFICVKKSAMRCAVGMRTRRSTRSDRSLNWFVFAGMDRCTRTHVQLAIETCRFRVGSGFE